MRKLVKKLSAVLLSLVTVFFVAVESKATQAELEDIILSQAQINEILEYSNGNINATDSNARVSGLINSYSLGANKDGTKLIIYAKTTCNSTVKKCGLQELIIQRRLTDQYEWSDYLAYEDIYDNDHSHTLSKYVTVPSGYQYRLTAVHYARKSLLSVEKIENTSNIVWI